jgi:hypothetical protein
MNAARTSGALPAAAGWMDGAAKPPEATDHAVEWPTFVAINVGLIGSNE